ncbi:MAG: DNA translocase FtsK [Mariniphaga sp.]
MTEETNFEPQDWWRNLDITWKKIFKRTIDINHNPDIDEIKDILNIEDIDCSGASIISLEPLQYLHNLRKLNCSNTEVVSLDRIRDLVLIDELDISNTKVKSLKPILHFSNLWVLKCNETPIVNLQGVEGCGSLEYLYCAGTEIKDVDPLIELKNLKLVDCRNTNLINVEPIKHISNILFDDTPYYEQQEMKIRDELFNEAAILAVSNQTGSTSAIQRRFSIGYNRAGRIMDQLEAAGIVSENMGSKSRTVLIGSLNELAGKIVEENSTSEYSIKSLVEQTNNPPTMYGNQLLPDIPEIVPIADSKKGFLKIASIIVLVLVILFSFLIIIRL